MTIIDSFVEGFISQIDLLLPASWGRQAAQRRDALRRLGPPRGRIARA
jgi:hypothetical protein